MKNILFIIIIISLNSYASSQILNSFGLTFGLTSANQLFDYSKDFIAEDEQFEYRYGLNFGIFAELFQTSYLSFILDFSYNQKGMLRKVNSLVPIDQLEEYPLGYKTEKLDRRFDYFTSGSNIKTRYEFENISPFILTGFRYDIFINRKIEKLRTRSSGLIRIAQDEFWEKYKGNLFGLSFGVGIEFNKLIQFPIFIEWIYNHDLSKVKMSENLKIQNLSNELRIGIKF